MSKKRRGGKPSNCWKRARMWFMQFPGGVRVNGGCRRHRAREMRGQSALRATWRFDRVSTAWPAWLRFKRIRSKKIPRSGTATFHFTSSPRQERPKPRRRRQTTVEFLTTSALTLSAPASRQGPNQAIIERRKTCTSTAGRARQSSRASS